MAGVVRLLKVLLNLTGNNLRQPYRHGIADHFVVEDKVVGEGLDAGDFTHA